MDLKKEMMELNINEIRTNPHQPRSYFDDGKLQILGDSIHEHGLNTPIEIIWDIRNDGKKATLKDGERRVRAMKLPINQKGYTTLHYGREYIIVEVKSDADLEYGCLIANCMREDLQPVEKGMAFLKILERRGIKNIDMAINSVNRAKDWVDNGVIAEPSSRNYFVSKETIKLVAKDMKMIGVSGTNAIDLLKITRLPKDIQNKIYFAPPNTRIVKEKMKINRMGDMTKRKGNDRGELIPISFGRELARLTDDKIIRFFLRTALRRGWTQRKLTLMVNDFLEKKLSPDVYIEAYEKGCDKSTHAKDDELNHLMLTMDRMSSTLTSWRTINLVAMTEAFKQKEFEVTGKGLLNATIRLKDALEKLLLTTAELSKITEEKKRAVNLPFKVILGTAPHMKAKAYRFTLPKELGDMARLEVGDTVEMCLQAVIKPINEKREAIE